MGDYRARKVKRIFPLKKNQFVAIENIKRDVVKREDIQFDEKGRWIRK